MSADGSNSPWKSRPFQSDVFLLASSPGKQSVIAECEPNLDEAEKRFAANGSAFEPDEMGTVVYDDGNVIVTERMEPGLKSVTINVGSPPGRQQAYSGRQNVGQRPARSLPMQGAAQRQTSQQKNEVVIPADSELPIGRIPQPEGPPPELSGWPKNSQFNDVCEIQDIDAAANLKTKYGENPCKPPPMKKDKGSNKLAAMDMAKSSGNSSPSNDKAQSSNPLVNTNISDDGCGPSQKPAQQLGTSAADSDISNYGTPGYKGNHIPKKPACSGGDHDLGGRYQTPTPYNPSSPTPRKWPEDDRDIESSGQYEYPPATPPPNKQYSYPPTPPPTPSPPGAYAGCSSEDLPRCPPEDDVYYDAPEDFYYDASSQAEWCPPGYTPTSKPCNFCHSRFVPLANMTRHTGRRLAHIHNAGVQHDKQGLECRVKNNKNEDGKPLLMQECDHTVIVRPRKHHHEEGCPWQRKSHHRIQPGDVKNTSFNRLGVELRNSSDLEVERRCEKVLHVGEQGQVHLNGYLQLFEPIAGNLLDGGNCLGREELQYLEDMRPSPDAAVGDRTNFSISHHDSLTCDLALEEEFAYINKDRGGEADEGNRENTNEPEPRLQNLLAIPHDSATQAAATPDQRAINSSDPCPELGEVAPECDAIFQESHPAGCPIPQSCSFYNLNLQRQRSNPGLPIILRLGSWVKDVLLPDYSK